jgi:DNA-binding MarR family transcriptional regulator
MDDASIDTILESMAKILPVFHRKLLRMDLGGITGDLSRLHFSVMGILSEQSMTVSEIARIALISKSQVTVLIDKLVEKQVVRRYPDEQDRRVIHIMLTDYGRKVHDDIRKVIKRSIREKLSSLTNDEITDMSTALETLRIIGEKI